MDSSTTALVSKHLCSSWAHSASAASKLSLNCSLPILAFDYANFRIVAWAPERTAGNSFGRSQRGSIYPFSKWVPRKLWLKSTVALTRAFLLSHHHHLRPTSIANFAQATHLHSLYQCSNWPHLSDHPRCGISCTYPLSTPICSFLPPVRYKTGISWRSIHIDAIIATSACLMVGALSYSNSNASDLSKPYKTSLSRNAVLV